MIMASDDGKMLVVTKDGSKDATRDLRENVVGIRKRDTVKYDYDSFVKKTKLHTMVPCERLTTWCNILL